MNLLDIGRNGIAKSGLVWVGLRAVSRRLLGPMRRQALEDLGRRLLIPGHE